MLVPFCAFEKNFHKNKQKRSNFGLKQGKMHEFVNDRLTGFDKKLTELQNIKLTG